MVRRLVGARCSSIAMTTGDRMLLASTSLIPQKWNELFGGIFVTVWVAVFTKRIVKSQSVTLPCSFIFLGGVIAKISGAAQ